MGNLPSSWWSKLSKIKPHWVGRSHGTCCPDNAVSSLIGPLVSAHFLFGDGIAHVANLTLFHLKWALKHVPSLGSAQFSQLASI